MDPKKYLSRYLIADREIDRKLEEISRLRLKITGTGIDLSADHIQSSPAGDSMARTVEKIVDMSRELDKQIYALREIKRDVLQTISMLPDERQKAVLRRRYINGNAFEKIAVKLGISYQWTCVLHGRGLQEIRKIIETLDRS